jgi:hypothetical protein
MTDFHWSEFALPATLLFLILIIGMATWFLHLLFPPSKVTLRKQDAAPSTQSGLPEDKLKQGECHDETVSHLPL